MEDVSHVGKGQCSSGCINPLLQHDIDNIGDEDNDMQYSDTTKEDTDDTDNTVTLPEETIPLIQVAPASPDKYLCIIWTAIILLSILLISLYIAGYLVPATIILGCAAGLALLIGMLKMCGQRSRRDLYAGL